MNKKLITAILGVGMGLASISAFSGTDCYYIYQSCINSGEPLYVCQARLEVCEARIGF